ncbi:MAG: STAS/SEC14 domain-containing protein [Pseudohongiellaceae bacterium]|jgi:hypothetical protein
MLKITAVNPERIDLDFSGQIDSEEMSRVLDELVELSANFNNGKMLYRIGEFRLPTMGAIGVEFSRMPKLFRMLGRFSKCAVVCDQKWLQNVAELEGKVIPGLEIKAFDHSEEAAAEAWLAH